MGNSYELESGVWRPCHRYKLYPITQPAAGADFSFTFPAGARYQIMTLIGTFTASVGVANRVINVVLKRDGNVFWKGINAAFTVATNVATLILHPSLPYSNNATQVQMPLPPDLVLEQNVVIASSVTTIQAADQWSGLFMWVKEQDTEPGDN